MKHFMQPQTTILRKAHSTDPLSSPSPSSAKPRPYRKAKSAKENAPPSDPNSMAYDSKQSPATTAKLKSQLPPRPPSSNPLNRKLIMETVPENSVPGASDSRVQGEEEMEVGKMMDHKRSPCSVEQNSLTSLASKRHKADLSAKERKEKLGERIVALQQLVSPYGKIHHCEQLIRTNSKLLGEHYHT